MIGHHHFISFHPFVHSIALHDEMIYNRRMAATITPQHCAYPGCDQLPAARGSERGVQPKYCDDPDHNPLSAHRERRRREAEAAGQRVEETGGQPVTFGLTRASELVRALEKITSQHADTLARAIAELRAVGDIESAEAEVYAARTNADQRVATAEARLAEEIQRRRDAEAERDAARAEREQADDATAQAITRMEELERELAELRAATAQEIQRARATADAEVRQAREDAQRDTSKARDEAARRVGEAMARAEQAEHDAEQAHQAEVAAIEHAHSAQAAAADEAARIRADHREALDQLTSATAAHISALEEARDTLRVRAERAEADADAARADNRRLAETLAEAVGTDTEQAPAGSTAPRARTTSRPKKTPATRTPNSET
jgi:colicin import membrane protein